MKITTIKKLQEKFVGKVCTILTCGIAKNNFADQQFADFFTGIVDFIDEDGIITKHPLNGCMNFYSMSSVVGILEEQFISDDNPEYEKIVDEVKNQKQEIAPGVMMVDPENSPYINKETLANLQKQAQEFNKTMIGKGFNQSAGK